jgi:hypothetical protein
LYKTIKNRPILKLFVKVLFTIIVLYILFNQVKRISLNEIENISIKHPISLALAIILAFINQSIEFQKWKRTLVYINESQNHIKSYMAGVLTGFLTPNLLGNFIGRMYYYPRNKRNRIIALTLLGNSAQFIASIYFGIISLAWLGQNQLNISNFNMYFASAFILLLLVIYFLFDNLPITNAKWKTRIIPLLTNTKYFRLQLLALSIVRYLVFSFQYILLLQSFGISFSFEILGWIWQIYFWSTLSPSLWMGKLFIRESIALWVLTPIIGHPEITLCSSVSLWIMNQGIIALVAIPFFKKQV